MKIKLLIAISILLLPRLGMSQISGLTKYAVQIGTIDANRRFYEVGSGLITYMKLKKRTTDLFCVVTARHVVNAFLENRAKEIYIRFSWADSLKLTEYPGIPIQIKKRANEAPAIYFPNDKNVDLAIIILDSTDNVVQDYYKDRALNSFPYNSIYDPQVGENILIVGYPAHIENVFNSLNYSVCTIKSGIVSWVPKNKMGNALDNYLLIEGNATHGNSGGPVFSSPSTFGGKPHLVGILKGGWDDDEKLYVLNDSNKTYIIPGRKDSLHVVTKAGVNILIRAELVKTFLQSVNAKIAILTKDNE